MRNSYTRCRADAAQQRAAANPKPDWSRLGTGLAPIGQRWRRVPWRYPAFHSARMRSGAFARKGLRSMQALTSPLPAPSMPPGASKASAKGYGKALAKGIERVR